ncbi:MAG: BREX-1 system phosphatase PglZ type A [Halanaerobiales bacterium]|nr:BREX-1 system phosphatase PglZ type A [Halanaerobiales bacterium]
MNLDEIKKVLNKQLNQDLSDGKKRNLVFWYDEDSEFVEDIDKIELENAKLLKLSGNNAFKIKYHLEKLDTDSNYLIYSSGPKPFPRDNWLLDIVKYSTEFSTDKTTVIMRDLGVRAVELKDVFKKYLKFFNAKDRYNKFSSYGITEYNSNRVHIGILSALCKLNYPSLEDVVKTVILGEVEDENKHLESIEKYGDKKVLWKLIRERYGYHFEEDSIEKLLILLMVAHVESELNIKEFPSTWQSALPVKEKKAEAIVFLNHFMNHEVDGKIYDDLADRIEKVLKVDEYITKWPIDDYLYCDTFRVFDEVIIQNIISRLIDGTGEFENYLNIISQRRTGHWYKKYKAEYSALMHAIELLKLESQFEGNIPQKVSIEMLDQYSKEYYLFDYHYRKFCLAYQEIDSETFIKLSEKVENTYVYWFLNELSNKWSMSVEDAFAHEYRIQGINQQKNFYTNVIKKHVENNDRVFVIISDALRYEAAKELMDILNTERRGQVEIEYMQGVVPSYTKLGMASLLPYKSIEYNNKGDFVLDGISTMGTENRGKILKTVCEDSIAITYDTLKDMKRAEFREILGGKKLVYIYHNRIDNMGHNNESDVFEYVEKTILDIKGLISALVNNLSAINIYVTSDHGFIYQRTGLNESDKLSKGDIDSIEEGRRFILTTESKKKESTLSIPMTYILNNTELKAVVPRGNNRFKIKGDGSKFAHEGIALQEIVIPLVKFKNSKKNTFEVRKVEVKLTNITRKLTNRITYLEFFQTQKVEDKVIPLRLKLYFEDEHGDRISNENIIIADSTSERPEQRTYREKFTLKDLKYDKGKKYYLVLEDEDESVEKIYQKIGFNIDLVFADDFGF